MEFLKKFYLKYLKPMGPLRAVGAILLGIVVLIFIVVFIGGLFSVLNSSFGLSTGGSALGGPQAPSYSAKYYEQDVAYRDGGYDEALGIEKSIKDITPIIPPPSGGGTTGDDAEEFEVTQYTASIQTRDIEYTCGKISALKAKKYIIFENANERDKGCNYTFKVARANVAEALDVIEGLDPRSLSEDTYTIKRTIEDFTSKTEILKNKLDVIDKTLEKALTAYDEITTLAIRTKDAESLTKIIDNKIKLIERLARDRINVNAQLESISKAKAQQLDKLEYTYFYVTVYQNKFVDWQDVSDSWKTAVKKAVWDINRTFQKVTVGLIATILLALQYILYILIFIVFIKYGWRIGRYIWKK